MNNLYKNVKFGGTAIAVLIATSFATAYGQGNGSNQPSGQGGTQTPANVVVTNTPAQPVPVKDQDTPSAQPFYWQGQPFIAAGQKYIGVFVPVPAGKRLVIEQVSAFALISSGLSGMVPRLQVTGGVASMPNVFVPMTFVGNEPGTTLFAVTQPMRMYADGGTSVSVVLVRSTDLNGNYSGMVTSTISLIGHLVNLP
jgi:hypothetical protein